MSTAALTDVAAPLALHTERVQPAWIDYNGHMNVAYYVLAFDHATDAFFDYLGLGDQYMAARNASTFTAEAHITYDREVLADAPLRFTTQLIDYDAKRLHYYHEMYHAEAGYLASTHELISLHVDMAARRTAPIPDDILANVARVWDAHRLLERPPQVGRVIAIERR